MFKWVNEEEISRAKRTDASLAIQRAKVTSDNAVRQGEIDERLRRACIKLESVFMKLEALAKKLNLEMRVKRQGGYKYVSAPKSKKS